MEVKALGVVDEKTVQWILLALVLIFFVLWLLLRKPGEEEEEEKEIRLTAAAAEEEASEAEEQKPSAEDDLKVIEGIGPKLEQVLKEAGIRTYRALAAKTPEELRAILDAAGIARISNPQTWPEQAQLAAEGRWEELKQLQKNLKGGVRRA